MADNVEVSSTASYTVASDDDGAAQHQYVKLEYGADGAITKVDTANRLPVAGASVQVVDAAFAPGNVEMIGGVRKDADMSPVSADGDVHPLVFEETGRLKVATYPGSVSVGGGNIVANGGTVVLDVSRYSNLMIHCKGTFAGANCTFEGSIDGATTWFAVQAIRSNANTVELTTGALSAAPAYAWELSVNGLSHFRVRATAFTSGTQVWVFQPGTYATEPIPGAQVTGTQPVSGTLTSAGTTTNTPATPTASIVNSAATTNGTVVKASAGTLYSITASNTNAAARYVKLYNSASVTVGTTAVALTIPVPPGAVVTIPFGSQGMRFGTGICLSITGAAADGDTTAVAANEIKVLTSYI